MAINEMVRKIVLISIMQITPNIAIRLSMFIGAIIVCSLKTLMTARSAFSAMTAKVVHIVYFVLISDEKAIAYITSNTLQRNTNERN
jgi:hypothetical protein